MKTVKIGVIFLGVVGLIVLIFFLLNRGSEGRRDVDWGFDLTALKTEIDDSWQSLEGVEWTNDEFKTTYTDRVAKLNRLTKSERLSEANKSRLLQYNSTIALSFLEKGIYQEWDKSNCSYTKVKKYHNMMGFLYAENEELKNQKTSKEVEECWSLYNQARALAFYNYSSIRPSYHFGGEWQNYQEISDSLKHRKQKITDNNFYRSTLSGINEIKNGLDEMESKIRKQKEPYYNSLAKMIIKEWKKKYPSLNDRMGKKKLLLALANERKMYKNEFGSNEAFENFYNEFRRDVDTKPVEEPSVSADPY